MNRPDAIKFLRDFMLGRQEFEFSHPSGKIKIQHDAGFLTVKGPAGWEILENAPDDMVQAITSAAGGSQKAEAETRGLPSGTVRIMRGTPGFEGANCIGVAQPGEAIDAFLERAGKPAAGAEDPKDKYIDPARNPFIRLDPDAPPAMPADPPKTEDNSKYLDPARNPFIKLDS